MKKFPLLALSLFAAAFATTLTTTVATAHAEDVALLTRQPGTEIAICGCGTVGQMADNIRAVENFKKMTPEECAEVRKRAIVGAGVYTGPTLEYWKKQA